MVAILTAGSSTSDVLSVVTNDGVILPVAMFRPDWIVVRTPAIESSTTILHPVQAAIIYALEPVWATIFALGLK